MTGPSAGLRSAPRDPTDPGHDLIALETKNTTQPRAWVVNSRGSYIAAPFSISSDELDEMALELLQAWQGEIGVTNADTPMQRSLHQEESEAGRLRTVLAAHGNLVLLRILEAIGQPMRDVVESLIERHINKIESDRRALVFMSDTLFPWRMLYADPKVPDREVAFDDQPGSVAPNGFLGMVGVVDHQPLITSPPRRSHGRIVPIAMHPGFSKLPGGRADVQRALESRLGLELQFADDEIDFGRAIATDEAALIYAFCHGRFRDATGGRAVQELILHRKPVHAQFFEVVLRRLKTRFSTAPIAFINACQGGVVNAAHPSTVIDFLRAKGAVGTVGPLVDMPTCFGGEFGAELIGKLAGGCSLSVALLEATRTFMLRDLNPLGLAYASIEGRNSHLPVDRVERR
ncbi:hypothetical protein AB0H12_38400 [Actinosynnema sp. NPDC023794]